MDDDIEDELSPRAVELFELIDDEFPEGVTSEKLVASVLGYSGETDRLKMPFAVDILLDLQELMRVGLVREHRTYHSTRIYLDSEE